MGAVTLSTADWGAMMFALGVLVALDAIVPAVVLTWGRER